MIVTIWRHGEAGRAVSDRLRELTGRGTDDIGYGCHQFHDICIARDIPHPSMILHSDWVRTTQTADIIATAFTHASMRSERALVPGSDVRDVDRALQVMLEKDTPEHLLLVSHQPLVSRLVDHYLADPGRVPGLPPGGLACLQIDAASRGCAELLFWALPPGYESER